MLTYHFYFQQGIIQTDKRALEINSTYLTKYVINLGTVNENNM
jgi:hypothetical protein